MSSLVWSVARTFSARATPYRSRRLAGTPGTARRAAWRCIRCSGCAARALRPARWSPWDRAIRAPRGTARNRRRCPPAWHSPPAASRTPPGRPLSAAARRPSCARSLKVASENFLTSATSFFASAAFRACSAASGIVRIDGQQLVARGDDLVRLIGLHVVAPAVARAPTAVCSAFGNWLANCSMSAVFFGRDRSPACICCRSLPSGFSASTSSILCRWPNAANAKAMKITNVRMRSPSPFSTESYHTWRGVKRGGPVFCSVPKLPTFAIENAMRNRVSSRTPVLIRPSCTLMPQQSVLYVTCEVAYRSNCLR